MRAFNICVAVCLVRGLVACLTLEWLALGVWVGGGLVLIGAVIPAVFNTFGGQDSGGLFLTRAFEGYHRFVIGALAILGVACGIAGGVEIRRWRSVSSEMMVLAGMAVITGMIMCGCIPMLRRLQAQAFASNEEAAKKAAFEALFRMLKPIRWIYMVDLVLGIALDRHQGETVSRPGRSAHVKKALLALADGTMFEGRALGYEGETVGEVVFNTAMTGYQEVLTDPSYKGQIITMTSPHIGNYGMTPEDAESRRIWAEGFHCERGQPDFE